MLPASGRAKMDVGEGNSFSDQPCVAERKLLPVTAASTACSRFGVLEPKQLTSNVEHCQFVAVSMRDDARSLG